MNSAVVWLMAIGAGATLGPAMAADIDQATLCSFTVSAYENKDMKSIGDIGVFVRNVYEDADSAHTQNGEPGILSGLSDEGLSNMIVMAVESCRAHPKETLYDAAAGTYRGYRDMALELGTAK